MSVILQKTVPFLDIDHRCPIIDVLTIFWTSLIFSSCIPDNPGPILDFNGLTPDIIGPVANITGHIHTLVVSKESTCLRACGPCIPCTRHRRLTRLSHHICAIRALRATSQNLRAKRAIHEKYMPYVKNIH